MKVTTVQLPKAGDTDCPVREILDRVGNKWSALILSNLIEESLRFTELKRRISGISQRMLTETLRSLERDGVLLRTVYPTIPPKVEYSLTSLGESLVPLIQALVQWALDNRSAIRSARAGYDHSRELSIAPIPPIRRQAATPPLVTNVEKTAADRLL